jgi:hypothetical protein
MKSKVGSPAVAFALEDSAGTVRRLDQFRLRWLLDHARRRHALKRHGVRVHMPPFLLRETMTISS